MENVTDPAGSSVAPQAPRTMFPVIDTGSAGQPPQAPDINAGVAADVTDGMVENGGEQVAQQPETAPEFQFELPSGSRYRTLEDMVRGATEKDFAIERMKAELAELKAGQSQPAQPQVDPQAQQAALDAELASIATNIERRLMQNPRWAEAGKEAVRYEAELQAYGVLESREIARKEYQQIAKRQQQEQFVASTPDLNTPLAQEIYDRARAAGHIFANPQAHLDAVHAEMYRRSLQSIQPQAGQTTAVQGALQNPQRPLFGNAVGTSAPVAPAVPEYVQNAVESAKQRGVTSPAELQRIQEFAMNVNTNRLNRKASTF